MRRFLYLLTLGSLQCLSCELTDIDAVKKDVEVAFENRTLGELVQKYGDSLPVELTMEDEYDEDKPVTGYRFDNLSRLAAWFDEKHKNAPVMLVPDGAICTESSCAYQVPERTLHHGTYLLGFESTTQDRCWLLTKVSIYWG